MSLVRLRIVCAQSALITVLRFFFLKGGLITFNTTSIIRIIEGINCACTYIVMCDKNKKK